MYTCPALAAAVYAFGLTRFFTIFVTMPDKPLLLPSTLIRHSIVAISCGFVSTALRGLSRPPSLSTRASLVIGNLCPGTRMIWNRRRVFSHHLLRASCSCSVKSLAIIRLRRRCSRRLFITLLCQRSNHFCRCHNFAVMWNRIRAVSANEKNCNGFGWGYDRTVRGKLISGRPISFIFACPI